MILRVLSNWLKSSSRKGREVTGIILHATAGGSAESSINWMRRDGVDASYHYIIEDDGRVFKCVPTSRKAWHAGKSVAWEGPNCNDYTIGIAFAHRNDGKEPYTDKALDALEELIRELKRAYPRLKHISTHYHVSPGRKTDPVGFPLKSFADHVALTPWKRSREVAW